MNNEASCKDTHLLFIPNVVFFFFLSLSGAAQRKASICQLHHTPAIGISDQLWQLIWLFTERLKEWG